MQIILANGTILEPIIVTGGPKFVNGANRDALTFVFPNVSMNDIDAIFTEENCETINIINNGEEAIHKGYVIRVDISKKAVETAAATVDTPAATEDRVTVTMAQRTYSETVLAQMAEAAAVSEMAIAELGVLVASMAE